MQNILLPASMENGTLARWLKREGELVRPGDVIAEIETDKAMMELESVHEGILSRILIKEGTTELAVDAALAVLASEAEIAAGSQTSAPVLPPDPMARYEPVALMPQKDEVLASVEHTVAGQLVDEAQRSGRIFASPRARRLAGDSGIDLFTLAGSGPEGRIIEKDIKAAGKPLGCPSTHAVGPPPSGEAIEGRSREIPHTGMRRTIAQRLTESKQTVPHFYLSIDCELDALLSIKDQLNRAARGEGGRLAYKLTVNDFLIHAWALALVRVPEANVSWTEKALQQHLHVDVGVAVAIPGGLITPILREAETKRISTLSNEMKSLAVRAKERKLRPEEYEGGTTSISNLGMLGIKHFAAILNPPQATILAVGGAEKRIVVKDDAPAVATVMSCTLSVDHRAVDGAVGARLLAEFKRLIENPTTWSL